MGVDQGWEWRGHDNGAVEDGGGEKRGVRGHCSEGNPCNPAGRQNGVVLSPIFKKIWRQNDVVLGEGGYKFYFFTSSSSLGFIGVGEEEGSSALSLSLFVLTGVPLFSLSLSSSEFLYCFLCPRRSSSALSLCPCWSSSSLSLSSTV